MPVSSPSYFPPNTSTDQVTGINAGHLATGAPRFLAGANAGNNSTVANLIVIGHNALSAGVTAPQIAGTVCIGGSALAAYQNIDVVGRSPVGSVVIGFQANQLLAFGGANVTIGTNAAQTVVGQVTGGFASNVVIGANAMQNGAGVSTTDTIAIGFNCATSVTPSQAATFGGCIIIGANAASIIGPGGVTFNGCILIGNQAGMSLGSNSASPSEVIFIGSGCCSAAVQSTSTVVIGDSIFVAGGTLTQSVSIGSQQSVNSNNVCIGYAIGQTGGAPGVGCIILGSLAGTGADGAAAADTLIVETNYSTRKALFFGSLASGNLIIGNSVPGTNRDFGGVPGTNMLKLLNGTAASGANVIGGGYFYVSAGDLHWVDSAGLNTTLSGNANFPAPASGATLTTAGNIVHNAPVAGDTLTVAPSVGTGALIATNAALTNNAGAQIATTTNGPLAGNPTKWIPINDNGTIRNIPAW